MTSKVPSAGSDSSGIGGTIALLNLPAYTSLSLDASASQTLKNEEDLLVISDILPPNGCHLLVVKGGGKTGGDNDSTRNNAAMMQHSIGILIFQPSSNYEISIGGNKIKGGGSDGWFIARKFDKRTEEISSELLDQQSYENLKHSVVERGGNIIDRRKIIPHDRLFPSNANANIGNDNQSHHEIWSKHLTNFISRGVLSKHELTGKGDKIVPGTFTEKEDEKDIINASGKMNIDEGNSNDEVQELEDGKSLIYPPIPHINESYSIQAHQGTRRYLANLTPSERTKLFLGGSQGDKNGLIFEHILFKFYDGNWKILLGQFQLSFVVFLCCSCLASLEHWRDTIQMLSLVQPSTVKSKSALFENLLNTLKYQLFSFDSDIFNDQEFVGGNFLLPAIKRLCDLTKNQTENKTLQIRTNELLNQLHSKIPSFSYNNEREDNSREVDEIMYESGGGDDDDDDGPIVVSMDEITASMERTSASMTKMQKNFEDSDRVHASKYPFLFASKIDDEDILMTVARILDEKNDVTAVREAAAYLEEVESQKNQISMAD
mmetsp:Transcript_23145/g.34459  ORF Transcript_23145/g.34459 Transcript_23145/m.34459 type:complete len:547 (+) Transcript_23145:68-1708(+)